MPDSESFKLYDPAKAKAVTATAQWVQQNLKPVVIDVQPRALPFPMLPATIFAPRIPMFFNTKRSKYKFSRNNWYRARYNWKDHSDVSAWCVEQFGQQPKYPDAWSRWQTDTWLSRILFRDEEDYVLFTLRWGNGA